MGGPGRGGGRGGACVLVKRVILIIHVHCTFRNLIINFFFLYFRKHVQIFNLKYFLDFQWKCIDLPIYFYIMKFNFCIELKYVPVCMYICMHLV